MPLLLLLTIGAAFSAAQQCETLQFPCDYNETNYDNQTFSVAVADFPSAFQYASHFTEFSTGKGGCSPDDDLFICAALFPRCRMGQGPCRSLCEKVRDGCLAILTSVNQGYNEFSDVGLQDLDDLFNCTRYLTSDCVEPTATLPSPSTSPQPSTAPTNVNASVSNSTQCPTENASYFTPEAKSFAVGWIATWATLCFLSTLITILTFLISRQRFQYPWRPIVYLAVSFNVHSLGYFFALILGSATVTCPGGEFASSSIAWGWQHVPCILVFGLLYYSMMAAFMWWLVLALCWFLAGALKWSNESLGRISPFFHVISWLVPLVMSISLVAARVISADELSGVCFVVRDDTSPTFFALLFGVILPLMVFLVLGTFFLCVGLISVCHVSRFLRHKGKGKDSEVLEKLMIRIGIFVTVYILPASVVIGCFIYELVSRPNWATLEEFDSCGDCSQANSTIFMVRIIFFLLIGILTGMWVWSRKTLSSWKSCFLRIKNCSTGDSKKKRPPEDQNSVPMAAYSPRNLSPPAIIPGFQQYAQGYPPLEPIEIPPPPPHAYPFSQTYTHSRQGSLPSTLHS